MKERALLMHFDPCPFPLALFFRSFCLNISFSLKENGVVTWRLIANCNKKDLLA